MPPPGSICVARYCRRVAASEARVWENVRDWEHLPWLHAASFRSIELEDESDRGWRAHIGLRPLGEICLELVIEPDAPRYVSRTLEGAGAGTEIWTNVTAVAADATDVEVEFWLRGVEPVHASAIGAAYTELYSRLWDEDEAMMVRRSAELARGRSVPSAPIALGSLESLRDRLPLCFEWAGERWRLVEIEGALHVHATRCAHWLGPLDQAPIEAGAIRCPWHGWRFDVASGRALDGRSARLATPPPVETDPGGTVWVG